MIGGIHQKRERYLEDVGDFVVVHVEGISGLNTSEHGNDAEAGAAEIGPKRPDDADPAGEAHLLRRFTERGGRRICVARLDLAAGERDLAGVGW